MFIRPSCLEIFLALIDISLATHTVGCGMRKRSFKKT